MQTTAATNGSNIILMSDTPAVRSILGPSLTAVTNLFVSGTTILNSQIFLNPVLTHSTTGAPNTYDLQSAFTKHNNGSFASYTGGIVIVPPQ
jgi:hypothetical protein